MAARPGRRADDWRCATSVTYVWDLARSSPPHPVPRRL